MSLSLITDTLLEILFISKRRCIDEDSKCNV